ncbi:MAG: short-chain dehydrogenase [Alphaproteobacteria bacterium HGW-Alphaproteobacteria-2]|nr:MAG: short-chain dehydrogenase [Alphaproteobacteria bacterium HGW-Alphaproteobacteria-2]
MALGLDDAALAVHPTVFAEGVLAGRRVLVSGGSGGIGRAVAWLCARLGAEVLITGRDRARLDATVAAMTDAGHTVRAAQIDIRQPDLVAGLFDGPVADMGGIDLLVNSAGGQFPKAAIDFSANGWNAVIDSNLNGTWHMMQAAARAWRDAGRSGSIVNIIVVVEHGLYGVAHTIAARSGVLGLSRAVAVEWAPLGIRVNCIAPGAIETPGWRVYSPDARATYDRTNPMMRTGTTWEVAEATVWLGGPSAAYVTGEVINVAGGAQLWGETWTTGKPDWFRD